MSLPKTVIHLLSGGLDSVTMLEMLLAENCKVHCLLFNYHQQHGEQELGWAKYHCHRTRTLFTRIDLPALGGLTSKENWIVPNRNSIMLNIAVNQAIQAGSQAVTIGCNADDEKGFPDCRLAFIQMLNNTLRTAEIDVEVCAPFLTWPKSKIRRLASDYGLRRDQVWSCYNGGNTPCGICPACIKMEAAFA